MKEKVNTPRLSTENVFLELGIDKIDFNPTSGKRQFWNFGKKQEFFIFDETKRK